MLIFLVDFAQEVKRSIVMYRRQKGADAIKRIFITGKGAQSEIIRNKISGDLEQDLELFNPLDGLICLPTLAVEAENLNIRTQ